MIPPSKYKNSKGRLLTKSLFCEFYEEPLDSAIYTMKDEDEFKNGVRYQSVYRLFLESNDPTGYKFAKDNLYSWEHFQLLMECQWFRPTIEKATRELEIKIRSEGLVAIHNTARDKNNKSQFQAAKFLLDGGWAKATQPIDPQTGRAIVKPVGRPTKDELIKQVATMTEEDTLVAEDYNRLINTDNNNTIQ